MLAPLNMPLFKTLIAKEGASNRPSLRGRCAAQTLWSRGGKAMEVVVALLMCVWGKGGPGGAATSKKY